MPQTSFEERLCPNCGAVTEDYFHHCKHCGWKLLLPTTLHCLTRQGEVDTWGEPCDEQNHKIRKLGEPRINFCPKCGHPLQSFKQSSTPKL